MHIATSTALAALSVLLAALPASAADPEIQSDAAEPWLLGVTVGGYAGFAPEYEGSDEYAFGGFPLIAPRLSGSSGASRLDFRGLDDIRFALLRYQGFEVGPLAGYRFERDDSDADLINGIGDVDGGLVVGGYAGYRVGVAFLNVGYSQKATGDDTGFEIALAVDGEHQASDRLTLTASVEAVYADDDYMDAYFSITPAQNASSVAGLAIYDADAGIKSIGIDLGARYQLTDRWSVRGNAGYARLVGDAADSPVVADENQYSGGLGLTYAFGRLE